MPSDPYQHLYKFQLKQIFALRLHAHGNFSTVASKENLHNPQAKSFLAPQGALGGVIF